MTGTATGTATGTGTRTGTRAGIRTASRRARPRDQRRRRTAALAGLVAAGLLSGCGQDSPGVAASIDDETISLSEVDAYAGAVCDYAATSAELSGTPPQPVSGGELRSFVLDLLIRATLTDRVADQVGARVPPSVGAEEPDAQTQAVIEAMPQAEGDRIAEIYSVSQRTAALARAIGAKLLADEGTPDATGDQADQRAAEAITAAEQDADITVEPRLIEAYAARLASAGGTPPSVDVALSVPVSSEAGTDAPASGSETAALSCS